MALALRDKRAWNLRLGIVCGTLASLSAFTPNALLLTAGLAILPVVFALLWRPGEPQILLFAVLFQWLQVFIPVVNASRAGEPIGRAMYLPEMEMAAWLGLVVILVLATGMRLGVGQRTLCHERSLDTVTTELSPRRLLLAYGFAFLIGWVATQATGLVPGLRQQLGVLGMLRWIVIYLIGWAALRETRFRLLASGVVLIELVMGFTGYFSSFKTILFLGIVLVLSSHIRLSRVIGPYAIVLVLVLLFLSAFWQAVKEDYRMFLSQGEAAQMVARPVMDRVGFLFEKCGEIEVQDLLNGLDTGIGRLGYLNFFALTVEEVPKHHPHQGGRLWGEAVQHVLMPRFLFADKAAINDSDRTNEFTGLRVSGVDQGTSISIGYAGESYIDFGPLGMFVPVFLLGYFWGWAYHWLATRTRHRLLGLATATDVILNGALLFESSNIKLLGGALTAVLVLWLVLSFAGDAIWRFMAPNKAVIVSSRH